MHLWLELMHQKNPITNPSSRTGSSSATNSISEPTTPDTSVAVIIGATLSALSTVCLLAILTWYLIYRRRQHSQPPEECSRGSQAPEHWPVSDGNGGAGLNDINATRGAEFYELDGQHNKAVELTTERDRAELGGSMGYDEGRQCMRPMEMDAWDIPRNLVMRIGIGGT